MPRKLTKNAAVLTPPSTTSLHPSTISTSTTDSNSSTSSVLPKILTDELPLPKLIIFDLDYTLWPFWVDTHVTPPLKPAPNSSNSAAVDRVGDTYTFYTDVPSILHTLPLAGIRLGVASRTHTPDLARDLLKILYVSPPSIAPPNAAGGTGSASDIAAPTTTTTKKSSAKEPKPRRALDLFDGGLEIYPSSKIRHMEALQKRTGVPFTEMLFYDDESRNRDVETLGVTMWLVRDGVSWTEVEQGVREWRRRRGVGEGTWKTHAHAQNPAAWQG